MGSARRIELALVAALFLSTFSCSREPPPDPAAAPSATPGAVADDGRPPHPSATAPALDFTADDIRGEPVNLARRYAGKVVLIVNVASRCGHTPQYAGLQALHERHADEGLAVLGFPCNQFGNQEPGTEAEILQFCRQGYDVTFDMFSKVKVNGPDAHPLYAWLTGEEAPIEDTGPVKWNFEKFLVGRDGVLLARYRSGVKPPDIEPDIRRALADDHARRSR